MLRRLFLFIFKLLGWGFQGTFDPKPDKYIVIVAPHTSNWDFPLGILVRSIKKIGSTKFLGKSQLFKFPYGFIFRAMGGYPVERTKDNNLVDAVVEIFKSKENFSISLAPEGTRSKVKRIRTGFYHIAKKAKIPIFLVGFDYGIKKIVIKEPFYPTENTLADFKYIINFFSSIEGKRPELGIDMTLFDSLKSDMESKKL
jgi:1-acyl-sn-glycerol-3-phosphate acyltransferase